MRRELRQLRLSMSLWAHRCTVGVEPAGFQLSGKLPRLRCSKDARLAGLFQGPATGQLQCEGAKVFAARLGLRLAGREVAV